MLVDTQAIAKKMYRVFRAEVIQALDEESAERHINPFVPSMLDRGLKGPILAFRNQLINEGHRLVHKEPSLEPALRRALAIPIEVPLSPTWRTKAYWFFVGMLPVPARTRHVRSLLQAIGSYAGRHFIYEQYLSGVLTYQSYFSPALDFAIQRLTPPRDPSEFKHIGFVEATEWLYACFRLGITSVDGQLELLRQCRTNKLSGHLACALVDLQVVTNADGLTQLKPDDLGRNKAVSAQEALRFRRIVSLLQNSGVEPQLLLRLTEYPVQRLDLQRLQGTLELLALDGTELSRLMKVRAEEVLLTETEQWRFLCEVMKVRTSTAMAQFGKLLKGNVELSEDLVLVLHQLGADSPSLVECQDLILKTSREGDPQRVILRLKLMAAPPYGFTVEELAHAGGYLCSRTDLSRYLEVLSQHGYTTPQQVLAFQTCYKSFSNAMGLDRWLSISSRFFANEPLDQVAQWVIKASKGGYTDSFDYLVSAGLIENFRHLIQALTVAPLGPGLLGYVVEQQKLTTMAAIRNWYFNQAPGVNNVEIWRSIDEIDQVLLDEAFARRDFSLVEGNRESVEALVSERVTAQLGPVPHNSDEETRAHYFARREKMRDRLITDLAPKFKLMLRVTEGILLKSFVPHIDDSPYQLRQRVAELGPRLSELLSGGGPTQNPLADVETDLVAMVYRTSPDTIRSKWANVIGREGDLQGRVAPACYPMKWQRVENELKSPLDGRGLSALAEAAQFARQFEAHYRVDMHRACYGISPKRLKEPSADVWSLARHLGLLLAIADNSPGIQRWVASEFERLAAMDEEGPQLSQTVGALEQLFEVTLDDALGLTIKPFVERLTPDEAETLASKLYTGSADEAGDLLNRLAAARRTVLSCYRRWIKKQTVKFDTRYVQSEPGHLYAVVSKSPAAFFAKDAANLCSSTNTSMWQESRHAHLLVFSRQSKRIMGMALLYFEPIDLLGPRPTLVVRALNPMDDVFAQYSTPSIVDSFFEIAQQIASDNDCGAVAFPEPMGMHLMSNHPRLEKEIYKRFMAPAEQVHSYFGVNEAKLPYALDSTFYAYEQGCGEVHRLYVIWHNSTASDPSQERPTEGRIASTWVTAYP